MPITGNSTQSTSSGNTPIRIASNGANITITSGLVATTVLQGYTLVVGDLVLLKDQTLPVENGVYVVPTTGSASRDSTLGVGSDAVGRSFFVRSGSHAGVTFNQVNSPAIVGTDALAFVAQGQGVLANFLMGTLSTGQFSNLAFGDRIKYDTIMNQFGSDITLNTITPYTTTLNVNSIGRITLKAGGTYKMMASALLLTTGSLFAATGWQNADTGIEIGADATQADSSFANTTLTSQPISCAFFSPTVDTRVQLIFKNAVGAVQKSTAGGNNLTWFSIEKIAGNTSVTGQSVDYARGTISGVASATNGSIITLDTFTQFSGNSITKSGNQITLQAGKTYELTAAYVGNDFTGAGYNSGQWYNITTGAFIGSGQFIPAASYVSNLGGQSTAQAVITPTVTTVLEFRTNTTGSTSANISANFSWYIIKQLGSTATVGGNQVPITLTTTGSGVSTFNQSTGALNIPFVTPVALARVRANTATATFSNSPGTTITWTNEEYDTTNSFTPTTGIFIAPRTAYYVINFQLIANITGTAGARYGYIMSRNNAGFGIGNPIISQFISVINPSNLPTTGGATIFMNAGDDFRLRGFLDSSTSGSLTANGNFDFISISELPSTI